MSRCSSSRANACCQFGLSGSKNFTVRQNGVFFCFFKQEAVPQKITRLVFVGTYLTIEKAYFKDQINYMNLCDGNADN